MDKERINKLFKLTHDSDVLNDMLLILKQEDASLYSPQLSSCEDAISFYKLSNFRMYSIKNKIALLISEERKEIEEEIRRL